MKTLIIAIMLAFGWNTPEAEPQACPSTFSQRAVRIGGSDPSYPSVCKLSSCRLFNYTHSVYKTAQDCNPVTGCHSVMFLAAKYQAQFGDTPANACPSDVSASPWAP